MNLRVEDWGRKEHLLQELVPVRMEGKSAAWRLLGKEWGKHSWPSLDCRQEGLGKLQNA